MNTRPKKSIQQSCPAKAGNAIYASRYVGLKKKEKTTYEI